jgi:negative regulator of sigma E activity
MNWAIAGQIAVCVVLAVIAGVVLYSQYRDQDANHKKRVSDRSKATKYRERRYVA